MARAAVLRRRKALKVRRPADSGDSAVGWDYTLKNEDSAPVRQGPAPGFPQPVRPIKPRHPPAASSQSGLSRVSEAATAAPMVTPAATQVRSEANPRTRPLAAINPIDSGTSAA